MKNYHTNENFTIWENAEFEYFIQLNGKEVEQKAYRTAAEAIEEAYKR